MNEDQEWKPQAEGLQQIIQLLKDSCVFFIFVLRFKKNRVIFCLELLKPHKSFDRFIISKYLNLNYMFLPICIFSIFNQPVSIKEFI